jgi:hypothetical protein
MKNLLWYLIPFLLSACSSNDLKLEKNKTFINKEKNIELTLEAEIELLTPSIEPHISQNIRDSIIAIVLGKDFIKYRNKKVLDKYALSTIETFIKTTEEEIENAKLYTNINGKIMFHNEKYITYRRIMTTGTTPSKNEFMTTCNYYVLDAQTGRHISENEIFSSQQISIIRKLLRHKAKEMANLNEIEININRVRPNSNFAIMDSTIIYTFNPYEIAEPQIGFIEIVIPQKELNK